MLLCLSEKKEKQIHPLFASLYIQGKAK